MINISDDTRQKLNVIFSKALLNMIEKAKKGEMGFTYHKDIMMIDGYDSYSTPNGNGEIYYKENGYINFQHFGKLGEKKNFVLKAVTNEMPNPTPFNVDSFDIYSYFIEFDVNNSLKEIIIAVLNDIKFEYLEMVINILQSDVNLSGNSKLLL